MSSGNNLSRSITAATYRVLGERFCPSCRVSRKADFFDGKSRYCRICTKRKRAAERVIRGRGFDVSPQRLATHRIAPHRNAPQRAAPQRAAPHRTATSHETRPLQTTPIHALGRGSAMLALPWLVAGGYGVFQGTQGRTHLVMVQGMYSRDTQEEGSVTATETKFISGLIAKAPHQRAPEYVKAKLSIKREELIAWLQQQRGDWINADVKFSRNGKWFVAVDEWKPKGSSERREPASQTADEFADDIPF
jgi:hypothetical protein